ncbi:hypothetical protein, partial [Pseudomonas gingeri]|uniref:hypothetical protein n=1 Tax=Pseudomonas gingeri TaxID=117681 RepID=UPI002116A781
LDPTYPVGRLGHMLADSAPLVALVHGSTRDLLRAAFAEAGREVPVFDLDSDAAIWAGQPAHNPDPGAVGLTPEHLA